MKRRWPKGARKLHADVWNSDVWLLQTKEDRDQADAYVHDGETHWNAVSPHGFACHDIHDDSGTHLFTVYVGDGSLSTLVHELDHATFMILDSAGVLDIQKNQEPHTYLLSHLFEQALKVFKVKRGVR